MPYFRGKNKFKHLEIAQGGVFQYHETGGTTFFVNGETGSNGKSGLSPADAKLTVKAALDLCTANKHDVVYILNYSSEAQVYEEWPIVVDVDQVHIIGVGHKGDKMCTIHCGGALSSTNDSAFEVTGHRVEIANLAIAGKAAGSGAGILVGNVAGVWGCYIHDCWFGIVRASGADCANGIKVTASYDAPYLRIEDCEFGKALTGNAILIAGNATKGTIANNWFLEIPTAAIDVTGSAVGLRIIGNRIQMDADTNDHGIKLAAGTASCFIDGNTAASQKAATTADNAWTDASSSNMWGLNYSGIVADLP